MGAATYCNMGRDLAACPIGDAAPHPDIENIVESYLTAKFLQSYDNSLAAEKVYTESGLFEDLDLLVAMESIWAEFKRIQSVEAQMRRKHGR